MPLQPLSEVFGFPIDNFSADAIRHRQNKLCPFNNKVQVCTKDKANSPLGVCSMQEDGQSIIICPVRFRENWRVVSDCEDFLLPNAANRAFVSEARLTDNDGGAVGNIDVVVIEPEKNRIIDFGALEIQAVYISGNIRKPFEDYLTNPSAKFSQGWTGPNYPGPDWLSSIKRLEHQLTVKGSIFSSWNKRMAVAIQSQFYDNFRVLHKIEEVDPATADMGWYLYNLRLNPEENKYNLILERTIYVSFAEVLKRLSTLKASEIETFKTVLEKKLKDKIKRGSGGSTTRIV